MRKNAAIISQFHRILIAGLLERTFGKISLLLKARFCAVATAQNDVRNMGGFKISNHAQNILGYTQFVVLNTIYSCKHNSFTKSFTPCCYFLQNFYLDIYVAYMQLTGALPCHTLRQDGTFTSRWRRKRRPLYAANPQRTNLQQPILKMVRFESKCNFMFRTFLQMVSFEIIFEFWTFWIGNTGKF